MKTIFLGRECWMMVCAYISNRIARSLGNPLNRRTALHCVQYCFLSLEYSASGLCLASFFEGTFSPLLSLDEHFTNAIA